MTIKTHITHLEDLFLESGIKGLQEVLNQFRAMQKIIEGGETDYTLSTKYDGAPSIVCGIHPTTGKFFVGTKSVFNKTNPKICYTIADIMYYYPDNENLRNILHLCLCELWKLNIKTVLQGDLMYVNKSPEYSTLSGPHQDGNSYIAFQPNTVKYAAPYFTDLGNKIMDSKLGIIFHTEYDKDWNTKPNPDLANLNYTKDVWFRDASFTMGIPFRIPLIGSFLEEMDDRIAKLSPSVVNEFFVNNRIKTLTNLFFNSIIRENKVYPSGIVMLQGFTTFIHFKMNDEIDRAVKSETTLRKLTEKRVILHWLEKNAFTLSELFNIILFIVIEKNAIVDILHFNESGLTTLDGHKHEGFVLSDKDHKRTKWVNRREFSAKNFANKKWEE